MIDGNVYKMSYIYNNSKPLGNKLENYSMDLVIVFPTNKLKSQKPKIDPYVFFFRDNNYLDVFSATATLPLRWTAV